MATASCLRSLRCCIPVASLRSLGVRSRSAALSACLAAEQRRRARSAAFHRSLDFLWNWEAAEGRCSRCTAR
ncbi:hypothetical protein ZIOFF_032413 [Zingiber officinale]|uniref:Uncharacterized protein n=1 Tax=Zingiber officinale TaxID=94328 RepID=A0A8J5GVJ1_ZINOF|nr:hypothetical protein ZIOFF_032413 [Zingiber officinale]